jgi:hypothetical protein
MCEEGTPHLTWYDHASKLSFEWDGKSGEIQVSNGDSFKVEGSVGVRNATISRWMQWFELVCHNYVRLEVKA